MEKQALINTLKGKVLSLKQIADIFKQREDVTYNQLKLYLDNGLIAQGSEGFFLCEEGGVLLCKVVTRKDNFCYVQPLNQEEDIRISGKSIEGYILGDLVYVTLDRYGNGKILTLYKREEYLIGNIFKRPSLGYFLHCSKLANTGIEALVIDDLSSLDILEGDLVKTRIIDSSIDTIKVSFVEVLVKANQVGSDISSIIVSNDAPLMFPEDVLNQAKLIPSQVSEEETKNRVDFRKDIVVTIDGADALDFDDAVSIKKIVNGYKLYVHIADVSHYVKPHTPIDDEAAKRGTSIYVADRVVPMLPEELSNGICSLNPNVDRLTLTASMNVSDDGEVYSFELVEGVIKSKARLTYAQVNDLFEKGDSSNITPEIQQMLFTLRECASKIRKRRVRYGALELDSTEIKFHLDENGKPIEILKHVQGVGEKLIEDLMIVTNVGVAKVLYNKAIPTLYRVHDNPPKDKISSFRDFLKGYASQITYRNFPRSITPSSLAHWLRSIEDSSTHFVISQFLLRSLAKAKYSPRETGHFGLGEEFYLHFTSPIRRYPDVIAHRAVKDGIIHHEKFPSTYSVYLENMALSTSASERRAVDIEREVNDLESCKYMQDKIGEQYEGLITNCLPRGAYIELDCGIDVFLPIDKIDSALKYVYSDKYKNLVPTNYKPHQEVDLALRLGQKIQVVIDSILFEAKSINVVTLKYFEFKDQYQEVISETEKEREALSKKPDYSRIKGRKKPQYRRNNKGGKRGRR